MNIDEILQETGVSPDSKYWDQLEQKFRDEYQELVNMRNNNKEGVFDEDITIKDAKLCKLIYDLHDFEPEDVEEPKKEEKEPEIEETVHYIEDAKGQEFTDHVEEAKEQERIEEEKQEEQAEPENETLDNKEVEKEIEPIKENPTMKKEKEKITEQEPVKEELKTPEQVIEETKVKEPEHKEEPEVHEQQTELEKQENEPPASNLNPEFMAYLAENKSVSAKVLKQLDIPREMWHENSKQFEYGGFVMKKIVAGLLFNSWTIEKINTGL